MPCYQLILKKFKPTAPARQTPLQVLKGDDVEKYSSSHKIQEHLNKVVFSQRFLDCDGLGNEVPFFICPFDPKETLALDSLVQRLIDQLHEQGIPVLHIHLFDLVLDILKAWGTWEEIIQNHDGWTTIFEAMDFIDTKLIVGAATKEGL